jgi:hypothetical protein
MRDLDTIKRSVILAPDGGLLTNAMVKGAYIDEGDILPADVAFHISTGTYVDDLRADYYFPANDAAQMPAFRLSTGRYIADPQAYYSSGRVVLIDDRMLVIVNAEGTIEVKLEIETPIYNLVSLGGYDYDLISEFKVSKLSPDFHSFAWEADLPDVIEDYRVRSGVIFLSLFGQIEYEIDVESGKSQEVIE